VLEVEGAPLLLLMVLLVVLGTEAVPVTFPVVLVLVLLIGRGGGSSEECCKDTDAMPVWLMPELGGVLVLVIIVGDTEVCVWMEKSPVSVSEEDNKVFEGRGGPIGTMTWLVVVCSIVRVECD
jgi:hypothetical protein